MSNMVVRTNVLALNSHRNLGMVGNQQALASARLSSGFRINSAADDAAGLGISEKMRAQIGGLNQAARNSQDGISLIQTAEGAMSTINDMVNRIRVLVVQAANDTNAHDPATASSASQSDRIRIQDEIDQLLKEIDATRDRTEFNTRKLINGELSVDGPTPNAFADKFFIASIGQAFGANVQVALNSAHLEGILSQHTLLNEWVNTAGVTVFGTDARTAMALELGARINAAMSELGATGGTIGPWLTSIGVPVSSQTGAALTGLINLFNYSGNDDFVLDAQSVLERALMNVRTGDMLETDHTGPLWFQVGANTGQGVRLDIKDVSVRALDLAGQGITPRRGFADLESTGRDMAANVRTGGVLEMDGEEIQKFLDAIDQALAVVTSERSNLGAMQNRLEFTIQNLNIASENLSASESRIRDADMAMEMMRLTQANVLQQAATAMLAQANQAPFAVLQLLN